MDTDQFLLEDLKLKVDFLNAHFQRMWVRFNIFITIVSLLIGIFFSSGINSPSDKTFPFVLIETFISLIWWMFGSQDRVLVRHYKDQVKDVAGRIATRNEDLSYYSSRYVSATPEEIAKDSKILKQEKKWNPIEWRFGFLSITRLAALIPLLIFLFGMIIIITLLLQKL